MQARLAKSIPRRRVVHIYQGLGSSFASGCWLKLLDLDALFVSARLGQIIGCLHPQKCIRFDPKSLFETDGHVGGQACIAVQQGAERLTRHAESLLERLGLPYRRLLLAAGDTGQSSAKTWDLEAWAPGVGKWLEVSSCSTFTDYQARRANIR